MIRGLAAALVILLVFTAGTAFAGRNVGTIPAQTYTCSAADRKFIDVARVNLPAFSTWKDDYLGGGVDHTTFAAVAAETAELVGRTSPQDRSLAQARLLVSAMLAEFNRAASEREAGGLGAQPLVHAQELDVTLRAHFSEAAAGLAAAGCEISALFHV